VAERFGANAPIDLEARVAALPEKRPGEVRVLAISDSFGVILDREGKNFFSVLERTGRANGADVVRVVNLSVAGTGVPAYLAIVQRYGARVRPDVVVVGVYLGNDIADYEAAVRLGGAPTGELPEEEGGFAAVLKRYSLLANAAFRLAKSAVPALRADTFERTLARAGEIYGVPPPEMARRVAAADETTAEMARADALNPWLLAYGLAHPGYYADLLNLPAGSPIAAAFDLFLRDLDKLATAIRALGARPVVALIPVKLQVEPGSHAWYRTLGYDTTPAMLGESPLVGRLTDSLASRGIGHVDLTPTLRAAGTAVYLSGDDHLNAHGNAIAGRALYDGLVRAGALPRAARN
jgi:hypothetical protein